MNLTKTAQTAATKSKLEAIARVLFSERGFEAVSAEELVAKAKVTRGARCITITTARRACSQPSSRR